MAHRVLEPLSQTARREAFEAFIDFLMTPAFGSWSKREIELKIFELLYRDRLGSISVADVAAELSITRSRARSLLLETRTRVLAKPEQREQALRELLVKWPSDAEIEPTSRRLRLVVDDPFVRDLLKNHAYKEGLLLDTSFASEIHFASLVGLRQPTCNSCQRGRRSRAGEHHWRRNPGEAC